MADVSDAELNALIAARLAGNKPQPGARKSAVESGFLVNYVANANGEWEVDASAPPTRYLPDTTLNRGEPGAAPIVQGNVMWDREKQDWVPFPGATQPREPVSSANGEFWQMGPDGQMHMVGASPSALEDRRIAAAAAQATAARAQEAERRANLQMQMNAIKMAQDANEIDAKRAQELRDYLYKTEVEFPAQQRQQEDVLKGNALTYGQTAGTQAVSDVTSMLPYRYSPGFMERRQQGIEAIGRGDYRPQTIARGYTGPDLTGTRQQAQGAAQGQYLNAFGFDPMPVANQIAYRPPATAAPGAALPQGPSGDDEEFLKRIARELAGTGGNP